MLDLDGQGLHALFTVNGLPRWHSDKEFAFHKGDAGLIPQSRRSPGVGYGNLIKYSCLGNSMNRGTLWATVHGVVKS